MKPDTLVLKVDTDALKALCEQIKKGSDLVMNPGNFFLERDGIRVEYAPVRHGHWYDEPNYLGTSMTMYFCSYCGSASYREDPYCWHCGSKMDVSDTNIGKMEDENGID